MVAKNSWGCEDTVIKTVQVDYDFFAYVPNAFTPNGDRTNDVFTPVVPPVKELRFDVYNRWGQRLFTTTNAGEGWDGTFNGQECKADVYAWKLYLRSSNEAPNHKQKEMMGEVTLIR
jgi:gliding motility-associated-like protein